MLCTYIYKNSNLAGKKCDLKVCKKSNKYCSRHSYKENQIEKEKEDDFLSDSKKQLIISCKNMTIIEDEIGYFKIHSTNYIVNNIEDLVVIGKIQEDIFTLLSDDDVKLCKEKKWKVKQFI